MSAAPTTAATPDLRPYRDRTRALLRRYFRMSIELGRLPSLVVREFFRARVTSYRLHTFEDAVIFVHDIETCLHRLDEFSQKVIARVVFQDYDMDEAAALLGCGRRTIFRRYPQALDRLSQMFLAAKLLRPFPCQEGGSSGFPANPCGQSK